MAKKQRSLVVEKIVFLNFKQFSGKQELVFGYSPKKFVNVIQGPGGSGKTIIFNAMLWCLSYEKFSKYWDTEYLPNSSVRNNIKNNQKIKVQVQIFFTIFGLQQKIMVSRESIYIKKDSKLILESDAVSAMKFQKNVWIPYEYNSFKDKFFPDQIIPFVFSCFNENLLIYIENFVQILKVFSNYSTDDLKQMISTTLPQFSNEVTKYEMTVKFDSEDRLQLIYEKNNVLNSLSFGESEILFFSILSVFRQVSKYNLPLIVDGPFGRLDIQKRLKIVKLLNGYFNSGQIILLGIDLEFKEINDVLNPIKNKHYYIIPCDDDPRNSCFTS